jgi:acyl carrier protein
MGDDNYDADYLSLVKEIVAGLFAVDGDDIRPATHFRDDIGMDSLDMVELVMALESGLGAAIADEDAEKLLTVGGVCAYLQEHEIPKSGLAKAALDVVQVGAQPRERRDYDEDLSLTRYVWNNYPHLMSDLERRVGTEMVQREKAEASAGDDAAKLAQSKMLYGFGQYPEVNEALKHGHRAFRDSVRDRLLREDAERVVVNRCPQCERILCTPQARQCLWCGFDWHEPARMPGSEARRE